MVIRHRSIHPSQALDALGAMVGELKHGDPLAEVIVLVPTSTCGVMARRALGRTGIAAIDVSMLPRLAERIGGADEARRGRSPVSPPLLDLAIEGALRTEPGPLGAAATHPSTVRAMRDAYRELRTAGARACDQLRSSSTRAAEVVRLHDAVAAELGARWYDEADVIRTAIERLQAEPTMTPIVVYLPDRLPELACALLRTAAERAPVGVIVAATGDARADAAGRATLDRLDSRPWPTNDAAAPQPRADTTRVISTTDADDECRWAVRTVVDAARSGTPFERMAIVWPTVAPYARLVEHHLGAADIPWNGRSGTPLTERLFPRVLLAVLDLDPRTLRRAELFALLADAPIRTTDGALAPSADWLRVTRLAGVTGPDDWTTKLTPFLDDERWEPSARSLLAFLDEFDSMLADPGAAGAWPEWGRWCRDTLLRLLGPVTSPALPEPEFRAWEQLERILRRLDQLDRFDRAGVGPTRHRLRAALLAELESATPRRGRVGDGVTVSSLSAAGGLDVDLVVLLGGADTTLPPTPPLDPLLDDSDRQRAGLPTSTDRVDDLFHRFRCVVGSAQTVITVPRGDLRTTASLEPSPWIASWPATIVPSHTAGLLDTPFPPSEREHRLRSRLHVLEAGRPLAEAVEAIGAGDPIARRGLEVLAARSSDRLTEFDGDLSAAAVPQLTSGRPVSPTRLEAWSSCPHAYFLRYLLGVEPVDEPGQDISVAPLDRGALVHAALDRFHREVIAGRLGQPTDTGWSDEHRAALGALFDEECAALERGGRTGRPASWSDHRDRLRNDVLRWLDVDGATAAGRGARVLASERRFYGEAAFDLPDGRRLELQGSIDRLDEGSDGGLIVTDHKTGGDRALTGIGDDDPTLGATVFQLAAYAAVAAHERPGVVHAEYGFFDKGRYRRHGVRFDGDTWRLATDAVSAVVDGIEAGWYPNRPERPGWRLYVGCEYCEPDHLGTDHLYADWVRKRHDPRVARWFGTATEEAGGPADRRADRPAERHEAVEGGDG